MDKRTYAFLPAALHYVITLALILFLSSCSHISRNDGPPNFPVDVSKVPDAKPKAEPLSKYGNMRSYRVFGKRYYTMRSSKNYTAVGVASWYGSKFHAQRTSSGERYDMLAMTAAHKTLPLPTYVEVTNLSNHRKIIVKVNDRGPFESNRIIDLSYVAAKKLGITGRGTGMVKIKAIDPSTFGNSFQIATHSKKSSSIAKIKHNNEGILYLQVGAFKNKSHAERLKRQLARLISAPIYILRPSKSIALYRVKVGPIKDKATAYKISSRLKTLGMNPRKIEEA